MFISKALIVCTLFCLVYSRPKSRPKVLKLLSSINSSEAMEEPSTDYVEKIKDIFDGPFEKQHHENLDNCMKIICMPHYLCINDKVVTNGAELVEWRTALEISTKKGDEMLVCDDMEMPCCADEAIKLDLLNKNVSIAVDEKQNEKVDQHIKYHKCGVRVQPSSIDGINNGDEALPNEFPWMVGIFYRSLLSNDLVYLYGGSLIHESVILTAAHKLLRFRPEQLVILAGEHDILDENLNEKRQRQFVSNIIIHDELNAPLLINEIALIVLEKPFKLTEAVNTICLPPQNTEPNENTICITGGWGKNVDNRFGKIQAKLTKMELPIVERQMCENILRKTNLGPFYNIDKSLMCAGGKNSGKDTCKGDGGSPLFCPIPYDQNRFYQTGIFAGSIRCGDHRFPGMYVNVAHFGHWISQQLQFIHLKLRSENELQYELFD